jgi:hypothetical protein
MSYLAKHGSSEFFRNVAENVWPLKVLPIVINKNSLGIKRYQFPRVVHRTTVRIFHILLEEITQTCRNFVQWSPKETAHALMPQEFRDFNESCRVIIDCTEIPVEQLADISQRVYLYSHYKKGFE